MAGNYYAYTCVYCSGEEYCSYRGENFSSRICRKCRHYEIMGIQIMQMRMNIMKHMKSRCITTPMNGEKITRMLTI